MKKFVLPVAAACLSAAIFALSGCAPQKSPSGVSLMGVQPADVGLVSECDYFVAAEPAATTRVNAAGLHFAGDIQQLYGSENGYPQAVVVAKNSLIVNNPHFLKSFLAEVEENEEWLKTASAETVISAVSSHLPEGTTPTFNAKNLTSEVISRCGIHLVYAADDRERVESFLKEMSDVDEQSVGKVKDEFFCEELGDIVNPPAAQSSCTRKTHSVRLRSVTTSCPLPISRHTSPAKIPPRISAYFPSTRQANCSATAALIKCSAPSPTAICISFPRTALR